MVRRMGFERAYAQGLMAGICRVRHRVTRLQVLLLVLLGVAIVAFGVAWDHPNRPALGHSVAPSPPAVSPQSVSDEDVR